MKYALFLIVILYFFDTGLKEAVDIYFFMDCHDIYKEILTEEEKLQYLRSPQEVCNTFKERAFHTVMFWGLFSLEFVVEIPIIFYIIKRLSLPFLLRKPSSLFVLIRNNNQLVFRRVKPEQNFVQHANNLYKLNHNKSIIDQYGNSWYIFKEGNNRMINDQVFNSSLPSEIFYYGLSSSDVKSKHPIRFLPKLSLMHLHKYWYVKITNNKLTLVPVKDGANCKYYYNGKLFNIEILASIPESSEVINSGKQMLITEGKEELRYVSIDELTFESGKHFSSYLLNLAYIYSKKFNDFTNSLAGSLVKSNKFIMFIILAGAAVFVYYYFFA